MLIGPLQVRHRARSASQLRTGMFSYHDSSRRQCGHADEGQTIDAPSGSRWMQTFRKLPTMAPNAPANEQRDQRRQRVGHERGRSVAAGSSGGGQSDDDFDSWTRPLVSSNGVPVGSSGMPRRTRARTSACQSARCAAAPRVVVGRALQRVDHVERLQLQQPPVGFLAQPVHLRRSGESPSTSRATTRRSPPWASVVAASERSHHGAPGMSLAFVEPLAPRR